MAKTLAEIAQHLDGKTEELSSIVASSLVEAVERQLAEELGFEQCGICGHWSYEVYDDGSVDATGARKTEMNDEQESK